MMNKGVRHRWIGRAIFALWLALGLALIWGVLRAERATAPAQHEEIQEDSTHG